MKGNFLTVFKKELTRFFTDRRMVLTTLLLPGITIYLMYSIMGNAFTGMFSVDEGYVYRISAVNLPASIAPIAEAAGLEINGCDDEQAAKTQLEARELDLLMVFPADFDEAVAAYSPASSDPAPRAGLYYNSVETESSAAYALAVSLLDGYESNLSNRFDVNAGDEKYDLATEKETTGTMYASMLPMLLMIFLFSGCMAVAPESIAGEKERGTIATLLVTPLRRGELALGKIAALALIALLSGISSATGTLLSLPKLMGSELTEVSAAVYTAGDYLLLGAVILSTVLVLITLISLLSALAKTVKEAQTTIMPLMLIVMVVGVSAMFGGGAATAPGVYLIPVYNSVQCMVSVFTFTPNAVNIFIAVCANLAFTAAGIFVLTRMFNNERVMFNR